MGSPYTTRHNGTCGWGWCVRWGAPIRHPDDWYDTGVATLHCLHDPTPTTASRGWSKADWIHRPNRTAPQRQRSARCIQRAERAFG